MHIGVIAPEFPPEVGGMQTYACEFVCELARRGMRVTVFTRPHPEGEISLPGVKVAAILKLRRALDRRLMKDPTVDAWHVMNASYTWIALETRTPVVVSVHGNDFLQPYLPVEQPSLARAPALWRSTRWRPALERSLGRRLTAGLVRQALPKATHILANSRYTEQVLLAKYPRCRGLTSAALVGVSPELLRIEPARTATGNSRLVTVCRLAERRKNVDVVLRALALLKDRHPFSYEVAGDGPLRLGLEKLSRDLGLEERVRFSGFVEQAALPRLLGESDLFVLASSVNPASHEGFGIAYLEANACGTPVLAARLAGAAEAVEEGVSGFFVERPDIDSIAAALERFFRGEMHFDPAACKAFARSFTWAKVADHAIPYYSARA